MENFHTELNTSLILFSGIRVPMCKETTIKNKFLSAIYDFYVIITDIIVLLNLITMLVGMLLPHRSSFERCLCAFGVMTCSSSSFKVIYCSIFRQDFSRIFKLWDNHFDNDPFVHELKNQVVKQKLFIKKISFLIFLMITPTAFLWGLLPYLPFVEESHGSKFTVIPAWFPFDITVSPNFELAVLFQSLGAVYVTSKNAIFDTIFYNLISRQTTQIKHLRVGLKKILSVVNVNTSGEINTYSYHDVPTRNPNDFSDLQGRLQIWIKHHQHTIRYLNCVY